MGNILTSFLPAVAVIINSILIVAFISKKRALKSHHIVFLNLAFSDTLMALYGIVFRAPGTVQN